VSDPQDMKRMKIFVWAGNTDQVDIMKRAGYSPVPLETAEILTGLQTGLVNALSVPPIFALRSQFETRAPHMIDVRWAILVGGAVVRKEAWDQIPAEAKPVLLEAARQAGAEIRANGRKEGDEAVAKMQQRGLTVHAVSPELEAKWRAMAEELYPQIRGRIVPADVFDEALRLLKEYRAAGGKP
jgi:TRAP-type C4-dicarboxylate transport system substrate-binding protein